MDILSHGLWAVAVGTGATLERNTKFKARWLLFWGMFPDLFAFLPVISYSLVGRVFGIDFPFEPPTPGVLEPWTPGFGTLMDITQLLYSISHSLVVFLLVVLLFYAVRRRIPWYSSVGHSIFLLMCQPTLICFLRPQCSGQSHRYRLMALLGVMDISLCTITPH